MRIKQLFPKFNLPVRFENLASDAGQYWFRSDCIVLNTSLKQDLPGCAKIVFLHEMIHSTGSSKRLMRMERLISTFGTYADGSVSFKMEECIAEIGCMIAAMKLGLYNDYSKTVILDGLEKNYTSDMYIPIREIRAALRFFADEDTSFEEEIEDAKVYLETHMGIKFQDSYNKKKASA